MKRYETKLVDCHGKGAGSAEPHLESVLAKGEGDGRRVVAVIPYVEESSTTGIIVVWERDDETS